MLVVVLFPRNKVVFVQLLLDVRHIAISLESLPVFYLIVEGVLVLLDQSILFISLSLIELRIEKTNLLCLM